MVEYIYTALPIYDPGFDLPHHPQHFMYSLEPQQHNICQYQAVLFCTWIFMPVEKQKYIYKSEKSCDLLLWLLAAMKIDSGYRNTTSDYWDFYFLLLCYCTESLFLSSCGLIYKFCKYCLSTVLLCGQPLCPLSQEECSIDTVCDYDWWSDSYVGMAPVLSGAFSLDLGILAACGSTST